MPRMPQNTRDADPEWENQYARDEGTGLDAIGFVRTHLRTFAAITAAVGLATAAALAVTLALPPVERIASMDITPTFPGAREGRYPNRAPYSPQDIVSNAIVEPVWRAQGLERSVELSELCRNIQVVQGGREVESIRSEYAQKLSNSKLTMAERTELEAEFASRMKAVSAATLTISVACGGTGIPAEQLGSFLAALPVEWARASDASGASSYDYPIPSAKELRASATALASQSAAAANLLHAERVKEHVDALVRAGAALAALPGSSGVRDAAGGSVADLNQEVESIRRNLVIPAYIDMLAGARAGDPAGYSAIRSTRLQLLESELEQAKERARVLREAFQAYADETKMRRQEQAASAGSDPRSTGVLANVDASFIDRVIEQAVKNRDIDYRRELSDRSVKADLDVVERTSELAFETWLDREVQSKQGPQRAPETVAAELAALTDRVAGLTDRAQEILRVLSARNLNPASAMFKVDSPPAVRAVRTLDARTVVLYGVGAWFACCALAVVLLAIRSRGPSGQPVALLGERQVPADHHVAGAVAGLPGRREQDSRRLPQSTREPVA